MNIRVTIFKTNSHEIKISYVMDYGNVRDRSRLAEGSRDALMNSEAVLTQRIE